MQLLLKVCRLLHLISKKKYNLKREMYQINRSKLFNSQWYLAQNPDVRQAKVNPLKHYLLYGWKEGRKGSPYFDENQYLEMYPDVKNAHLNPLLHWVQYGKKEGRYAEINFNGSKAHNWEWLKKWLTYPIEVYQEYQKVSDELIALNKK